MLDLLDCSEQGPVLHFTFMGDGLDDREWHHATPADPLVSLFNEVLLPLARERGGALSSAEVVRRVIVRASAARVIPSAIDWLGLALYAARRYREAAIRLLNGETADIQEECATLAVLAGVLDRIYGRLARVIGAQMTHWQEPAA
jgi:hypothetical protein